jgi:thioredoxin 1
MKEKLPTSFNELLQQHDKPILVDFWAPWCGPCNMVAPEIKKVSEVWKDKVTVIKLNTDEKPEIANQFNITGIPTMILFKNGKEIFRKSGAMRSEDIQSTFGKYI